MSIKKFIILTLAALTISVSGIIVSAVAQENSFSDEYILLKAVKDRDYGKVRTQLQKGANVNTRDFTSGETPLYMAATLKDTVSATFLLAENANADIPNKDTGETPLMVAVRLKDSEFVDLLVKQGADVNLSDRNGETALYKAVQVDARTIVKTLLEASADWSIADNTGRTPLDVARENRRLRSIVRILEEEGAEY